MKAWKVPRILDLSSRCRRIVSSKLRPFHRWKIKESIRTQRRRNYPCRQSNSGRTLYDFTG